MTMSADALRVSLVLLGCMAAPAVAAEEPPPDAEFLEYLGSWEGADEDWLLFEGAARDAASDTGEEQRDSQEESPEPKNEH